MNFLLHYSLILLDNLIWSYYFYCAALSLFIMTPCCHILSFQDVRVLASLFPYLGKLVGFVLETIKTTRRGQRLCQDHPVPLYYSPNEGLYRKSIKGILAHAFIKKKKKAKCLAIGMEYIWHKMQLCKNPFHVNTMITTFKVISLYK